jgi:hypothetical protein
MSTLYSWTGLCVRRDTWTEAVKRFVVLSIAKYYSVEQIKGVRLMGLVACVERLVMQKVVQNYETTT